MTQRKMQSQVEEEDMLEENRPEVLRMEIESLSRNEEFVRVVVSVFMARMNPTLEEPVSYTHLDVYKRQIQRRL